MLTIPPPRVAPATWSRRCGRWRKPCMPCWPRSAPLPTPACVPTSCLPRWGKIRSDKIRWKKTLYFLNSFAMHRLLTRQWLVHVLMHRLVRRWLILLNYFVYYSTTVMIILIFLLLNCGSPIYCYGSTRKRKSFVIVYFREKKLSMAEKKLRQNRENNYSPKELTGIACCLYLKKKWN